MFMNGETYKHYLKGYMMLNGLLKEYANYLKVPFNPPETISADCE